MPRTARFDETRVLRKPTTHTRAPQGVTLGGSHATGWVSGSRSAPSREVVQDRSQLMSAHLTVYAMALEAEGPVRMREANQARRIALAVASAEPRSSRL